MEIGEKKKLEQKEEEKKRKKKQNIYTCTHYPKGIRKSLPFFFWRGERERRNFFF